MADPRVVLLNDTDVDGHHFGCARVMAIIRDQLTQRGRAPSGSVAVSLNWQDAHSDLVNRSDILVINGEGTLHHASRKGRWLLEAAQSVKARGGRVALINALWQDNPNDWAELIRDVDILSCRDSRSAAALSKATGRDDVRMIGDLSMSQPAPRPSGTREGLVFGDSVHAKITTALASLAARHTDAELVPVTATLKFVSPNLKGPRRALRKAYATLKQNRFLAGNTAARFVATEAEYLSLIANKSLSVTGRFHAVCLAIATQTPFIAISSNSWKIEALVEDIGLNSARIMALSDLARSNLEPEAWAFSPTETAQINAVLGAWHTAANRLFDDIAALA